MKTRNVKLTLIHLVTYVLFLLPVRRLDLFRENYSTLSLHTEGYFYFFFLGILLGSVLSYDTYRIAGKRNAKIIFAALIIGTMIPLQIPYRLRGYLHLLCSYTGSFVTTVITYFNLQRSQNRILKNIFTLSVLCSILLYIRIGMVSTILEVVLMTSILWINYSLVRHINQYSKSFN